MSAARSWLDVAEKGSVFGLRFLFFLATAFGRTPTRLALRPVVLYYVLFHGDARRASQLYLERLSGTPARFGDVYRHVLRFAEVALDRIFLLQGKFDHFEIAGHNGLEHLQKARDEKRGALLLGAHLGSFEAMRALGEEGDLPVNIVTYSRNAKMLSALLTGLNPKLAGRVIEIDRGVDSMLKMKACIEKGEFIAVLGDRPDLNGKVAIADFLGAPARFPTGLYVLAAVLRCPVFLTVGLYTAPNRYEFFCEPFLESLDLPRKGREEAIQGHVQRYAQRLEHYCRRAPDNWFNFFDFWSAK